MTGFRFPSASDRTFICGRTGSGKTRFGTYLYSFQPFHQRPHIIIDFKGDDLLMQIDRARQIDLNDKIKHPGLYYLRVRHDQQFAVERWLWNIHARGNASLYIDEGYMIRKDSPAFNAILTQGRSLKIPVQILTQRPAWCNRFIVSEASFFAIFKLQDQRDYDTVSSFTPDDPVFNFAENVPPYTCRWYDVSRDYSALLKPAPDDDTILARYDDALRLKTRMI